MSNKHKTLEHLARHILFEFNEHDPVDRFTLYDRPGPKLNNMEATADKQIPTTIGSEVPLKPSVLMATQNFGERPPIEDAEYLPANRKELSNAASVISSMVPPDQIDFFYDGLHKLFTAAQDREGSVDPDEAGNNEDQEMRKNADQKPASRARQLSGNQTNEVNLLKSLIKTLIKEGDESEPTATNLNPSFMRLDYGIRPTGNSLLRDPVAAANMLAQKFGINIDPRDKATAHRGAGLSRAERLQLPPTERTAPRGPGATSAGSALMAKVREAVSEEFGDYGTAVVNELTMQILGTSERSLPDFLKNRMGMTDEALEPFITSIESIKSKFRLKPLWSPPRRKMQGAGEWRSELEDLLTRKESPKENVIFDRIAKEFGFSGAPGARQWAMKNHRVFTMTNTLLQTTGGGAAYDKLSFTLLQDLADLLYRDKKITKPTHDMIMTYVDLGSSHISGDDPTSEDSLDEVLSWYEEIASTGVDPELPSFIQGAKDALASLDSIINNPDPASSSAKRDAASKKAALVSMLIKSKNEAQKDALPDAINQLFAAPTFRFLMSAVLSTFRKEQESITDAKIRKAIFRDFGIAGAGGVKGTTGGVADTILNQIKGGSAVNVANIVKGLKENTLDVKNASSFFVGQIEDRPGKFSVDDVDDSAQVEEALDELFDSSKGTLTEKGATIMAEEIISLLDAIRTQVAIPSKITDKEPEKNKYINVFKKAFEMWKSIPALNSKTSKVSKEKFVKDLSKSLAQQKEDEKRFIEKGLGRESSAPKDPPEPFVPTRNPEGYRSAFTRAAALAASRQSAAEKNTAKRLASNPKPRRTPPAATEDTASPKPLKTPNATASKASKASKEPEETDRVTPTSRKKILKQKL